MLYDSLAQDLYTEICRIPLVDPHSHIQPSRATARNLDEILSCHDYTELAHSAGMEPGLLCATSDPRERARTILSYMAQFDNTAQYQWFLEITRAFLDYQAPRLSVDDCDWLCDTAETLMSEPTWEEQVWRQSNLEKIFVSNEFDDPLDGFDVQRYVPCLRVDDIVFQLGEPVIRQRLAKATRVEVGDLSSFRLALSALFERFTERGARACVIALPPDFRPVRTPDHELSQAIHAWVHKRPEPATHSAEGGSPPARAIRGIFWMFAEHCRAFRLPFHLLIGSHRRSHRSEGQDQDLFDQRTSLVEYADLFNAFPTVPFCVSVPSSGQNQELASYSMTFANLVTSGHWWRSNVPTYIDHDARARLQVLPKTKQLGYYSDAYKLEFVLPKYNMYRRILAQILADDFVKPRIYTQAQAIEFARLLLHDNACRIFNV